MVAVTRVRFSEVGTMRGTGKGVIIMRNHELELERWEVRNEGTIEGKAKQKSPDYKS